MKKTTTRKPIRRVTSAEEQKEIAELKRYRTSLRRIQETERLAKAIRRARSRAQSAVIDLARTIARELGYEFVEPARPAAVNE